MRSNSFDPYFYISLDDKMLFLVGKGTIYGILRFYKNSDSVILGRFQQKEFEVDEDNCVDNGIKILQSISGGGAVFHDSGNLNISVIVGEEVLLGKYIMDNMKFISSKIVYALNSFGLETRLYNNIFIKDKKVSSCAVSRKYGGFLYHTTLLLNTNLEKLKKALNPQRPYSEDPKYIKSNRSEVMNVYEIKFINEIELMEAIYREITLFFKYA